MAKQMNCHDIDTLLIPYLDKELDPEKSAGVREHLRACATCRQLADEHHRLWHMLDELPGTTSANGETDQLLPNIRAACRRYQRQQRFLGWTASAAAALILISLVLAGFFGSGTHAAPPDPVLLANLDVVEDYASLAEVGGEDLVVNPELMNVAFELSQVTLAGDF